METDYVAKVNMVTIECCRCHMTFGVPKEFDDDMLELKSSGSFYCPRGHSQHYTGKSLKSKMKEKERQLANLKSECATLQECCIDYQQEAKVNNYRARAYKGQITKLKRAS